MLEWTEIARTSSVGETQAVAAALAGAVVPGSVIMLDGDLGAGKTHFTQGLAVALGIAEPVTSPTFNLVCEYHDGRLPLYHFDLYRLEEPEELEDIDYYGITEGDGVSLVEWGDKFEEAAPDDCLVLDFKVSEDGTRTIHANATGERANELVDGLF